MPPTTLTWCGSDVTLRLRVGGDHPVSLLSARPPGTGTDPVPDTGVRPGVPLTEIQALGQGRFPGGHRYADTVIGARLRYADHTTRRDTALGLSELRLRQRDPATGLVATTVLVAFDGVPAVRAHTEVTVESDRRITLQAVTSLATGAFLADGGGDPGDWELWHADCDWVAESRWHRTPLREAGLPWIDPGIHHHASRSRFALTSRGSWSTGEHLPTGLLARRDGGWAIAWQIEHNGAWHWEVGEHAHGAQLALLGPTDAEHQWTGEVHAGRGFTTVPVSLAIAAGGPDDALAALTRQRRALRRPHRPVRPRPPTAAGGGTPTEPLPVIFNDYMNTLMGDPTTAKLLPLIDAAASVGAEYFCVDAGWYAGDGGWWDAVGEWRPSAGRFPGGIEEVLDRIRDRDMVPGLWLEPEVVGVRSPVADHLPEEAFFRRLGHRVVEHGRYHLDLRHPAARRHLDEVVDRLVTDLGVGYLKLDYNIMPGPGTDTGGEAPGAGLLGHNRAHLAWLDTLMNRYPDLLIENCASGAMRMDWALLARLHIQSTSDQQNPLLYPPIAAAAPASVLPEQAGNWAYAQPGMTPEEAAFTLATGVLGRLYLAGRLDLMEPGLLDPVREAVRCHRELLPEITRGEPFWPLGLAGPPGRWVAHGLRAPEPGGTALLTAWRLPGADAGVSLPVPHLRGRRAVAEVVFPAPGRDGLLRWEPEWEEATGTLRVRVADGPGDPPASARVLRVRSLDG